MPAAGFTQKCVGLWVFTRAASYHVGGDVNRANKPCIKALTATPVFIWRNKTAPCPRAGAGNPRLSKEHSSTGRAPGFEPGCCRFDSYCSRHVTPEFLHRGLPPFKAISRAACVSVDLRHSPTEAHGRPPVVVHPFHDQRRAVCRHSSTAEQPIRNRQVSGSNPDGGLLTPLAICSSIGRTIAL